MNDKAKRTGVYLASANWDRLALLLIGAGAAWHYVAPWLASVVLPAILHHAYQARVIGFRALADAALRQYLVAAQGASEDQADRIVKEEGE